VKTDVHWEKVGLHTHHGIALPLFSLRSKKSCGIGEFNDLIPIIDWCASLKLDVIQLLPINDTGEDTSPYNAVSSCALNPIYLSLADLPGATNLSDFEPLTKLPRIAYNEVRTKKLHWLYDYYLQNYKTVSAQSDFQTFVQENPWLQAYANYKNEGREDFNIFLQFLCFEQLKRVRAYATSLKVFLKGDIPILLSPQSADCRSEPELFDLTLDAGAPPDFYNPLGQHWGFPLMNWETMRKNHFNWWKRRLSIAENFFHIYRIDHVVGLFRIWGIPKGEKPFNGQFVPADATLWVPQGREILEMMIDSTTMLPIAEDLGVVPEEVRHLLKELGICGTSVIRWEKKEEIPRPYEEYNPFTLTTVSTHDSEPLLVWWKNYSEEAKSYAKFKNWPYSPELTLDQRIEILKDSHHTTSYFHINPLQEYLTIFPEFSWEFPEDERINIPGTVWPTNWTYRFRPYVEEIIASKPLADLFKQLLLK